MKFLSDTKLDKHIGEILNAIETNYDSEIKALAKDSSLERIKELLL